MNTDIDTDKSNELDQIDVTTAAKYLGVSRWTILDLVKNNVFRVVSPPERVKLQLNFSDVVDYRKSRKEIAPMKKRMKTKTKTQSVNVPYVKPSLDDISKLTLKQFTAKSREGANTKYIEEILATLVSVVRHVPGSFTVTDILNFSRAKDFDVMQTKPICEAFLKKCCDYSLLRSQEGSYDMPIFISNVH